MPNQGRITPKDNSQGLRSWVLKEVYMVQAYVLTPDFCDSSAKVPDGLWEETEKNLTHFDNDDGETVLIVETTHKPLEGAGETRCIVEDFIAGNSRPALSASADGRHVSTSTPTLDPRPAGSQSGSERPWSSFTAISPSAVFPKQSSSSAQRDTSGSPASIRTAEDRDGSGRSGLYINTDLPMSLSSPAERIPSRHETPSGSSGRKQKYNVPYRSSSLGKVKQSGGGQYDQFQLPPSPITKSTASSSAGYAGCRPSRHRLDSPVEPKHQEDYDAFDDDFYRSRHYDNSSSSLTKLAEIQPPSPMWLSSLIEARESSVDNSPSFYSSDSSTLSRPQRSHRRSSTVKDLVTQPAGRQIVQTVGQPGLRHVQSVRGSIHGDDETEY